MLRTQLMRLAAAAVLLLACRGGPPPATLPATGGVSPASEPVPDRAAERYVELLLAHRAVDLACHEGYPGHHVDNALLERELVIRRDFVEHTVFDTYRSYVINYNLGQDLLRARVETLAGDDAAARWRAFGELLSTPGLPSGLATAVPERGPGALPRLRL